MLDDRSLQLYRYAVSHPGWLRTEASEQLGYTLREIGRAVDELTERRLLAAPAPGTDSPVAISPDVALADLVDEDERTLLDLRTKIGRTRREMSSLVPAFLEARKEMTTSDSVEVLEDPSLIRRVLIDYGRDVTEQVLITQPGHGASADVHEESIKKDLDLLHKGVVRRNIYHQSTRDHLPTRRAVEALTPAGAQHRTLPHVPIRLMIFDHKLALISRDRSPDDRAALVVRDVNLVEIFTRFFTYLWETGDPFTGSAERAASPLNSVQRSVLDGLASGYSDETIARRLDISVRTCRRHIAWMLEELGAESRFQAGVKARDAGWL